MIRYRWFRIARLTWSLFGSLNHYWGCESLSFWEYVYKKRMSFKSSFEIAKDIHSF